MKLNHQHTAPPTLNNLQHTLFNRSGATDTNNFILPVRVLLNGNIMTQPDTGVRQ